MKKNIVLLVILLSYSAVTMAQDLQKSILGIDAGVNISTLSISGTFLDMEPSRNLGFHAGVSYQRLLLKSAPLYLQTGVYFSQKGAIYKEDRLELALNTSHIQIPLMLNYRVKLGSSFAIVPSLGVYYGYGVAGKYSLSGTSDDSDYDDKLKAIENYVVYGDNGELKRSTLGLRYAVGFEYKKIALTIGYESDMTNNSKIEPTVNDRAKTRNRLFSTSIGYRF